VIITVEDKPGQLNKILTTMQNFKIDMTSIHSKPPKHNKGGVRTMNFHIDFVGDFKDLNV